VPTILDSIIAHKRKEVAERQSLVPRKLLERSLYFNSAPLSLRRYLLRDDLSGIIAEFKRKSPSKGWLNATRPSNAPRGLHAGRRSALSVLTDGEFFGGKNDDLTVARALQFLPHSAQGFRH
jgi:indole-3-glycerol phosphate synthase